MRHPWQQNRNTRSGVKTVKVGGQTTVHDKVWLALYNKIYLLLKFFILFIKIVENTDFQLQLDMTCVIVVYQ